MFVACLAIFDSNLLQLRACVVRKVLWLLREHGPPCLETRREKGSAAHTQTQLLTRKTSPGLLYLLLRVWPKNHRISWVGRGLKDPTHCHGQGCHPLDQAAHSHDMHSFPI